MEGFTEGLNLSIDSYIYIQTIYDQAWNVKGKAGPCKSTGEALE